MNRAQRTILAVGSLVVVVLIGFGSWTFTSTVTKTETGITIPMTTVTWTETSRCSILFGARGLEAPGRPDDRFSLPGCDAYDAWREPMLAGIGAAALLTLLAVLWSATPRSERPDGEPGDEVPSDDQVAEPLSRGA